MAISRLEIEVKTNNQGATSAGRLTADNFNDMKDKVNELVDNANKRVYLTEEEYQSLLGSGGVQDDVEYNIL